MVDYVNDFLGPRFEKLNPGVKVRAVGTGPGDAGSQKIYEKLSAQQKAGAASWDTDVAVVHQPDQPAELRSQISFTGPDRRQFQGVANFFDDEVADDGDPAPVPVSEDERPRRGQPAVPQAVTRQPGPQRRRRAEQVLHHGADGLPVEPLENDRRPVDRDFDDC